MCKSYARALAAAFLAVVLAAPAVHGQTQAEYRARVEQLVPLWKREVAAYQREDSLRKARLPRDTMRVDGLVLLADSALRNVARSAAALSAGALRRRFGSDLTPLRSEIYTVSRNTEWRIDTPMADVGYVDSTGRVAGGITMPATADAIAESWTGIASQRMTAEVGPNFGEWLSNAIPVDSAATDTWVGVRIDVVTSQFAVSRQCYAGSISACELALGIRGTNDPLRSWFNAAERRGVVLRDWDALHRTRPDLMTACVMRREDSACVEAGELISKQALQPPLGTASRQALARLALDLGGAAGFARLRAAPDSIGAQLAAAAGIPLDSLVARWRTAVVSTAAEHTTMTPGVAMMSICWVTACGALALRSSRWR